MESVWDNVSSEMQVLEQESDKIINPENFYVIKIKLADDHSFNSMKKWTNKILKQENSPSCVYLYMSLLFLIFPCCVQDKEHFLSGSHHSLISYYTSKIISLSNDYSAQVSIIEFTNKIQLFTYFSYQVYSNSVNTLLNILGKPYRGTKTHAELLSLLDEGVWDNLEDHQKYGIFYRRYKKGLSSLSEILDCRNETKYTTFILG